MWLCVGVCVVVWISVGECLCLVSVLCVGKLLLLCIYDLYCCMCGCDSFSVVLSFSLYCYTCCDRLKLALLVTQYLLFFCPACSSAAFAVPVVCE